jgi:flagellar motor protein MotB
MFDEAPTSDGSNAGASPVWTVFGDLMAGLLGMVVLLLVWAVAWQVDLATDLAKEKAAHSQETDRRARLEKALAGPLAAGRIQFVDGRIGISGRVLFDLYSADLKPDGAALLKELAGPLAGYLDGSEELVMVSGFTDDLPIHGHNPRFADNWELSAQRALTVTRALVAAGIPPDRLFSAGFGEQQPVTANVDEASRSQNRRVEIVPVPRRHP